MYEKQLPGGQMNNTEQVENYLGFPGTSTGPELVTQMVEHVKHFGIEAQTKDISIIRPEGDHFVLDGSDPLEARSVLVATGSHPRKLGIPGEDEFYGSGVSYCATCDGFFFREREVVVVGGGDAACEESLYLARICKKVTIIHRRDELRAVDILRRRAFEMPNIEFAWDTVVDEVLGDGKIHAVRTRNVKTDQPGEIPCDGVFIYIGNVPNSGIVKGVCDLDEGGYIMVDLELATSVKGIVAAGDVRQKSYRQIASAVGDGCAAALTAARWVLGGI
jgi:thioredoxin reductase (NADPH)